LEDQQNIKDFFLEFPETLTRGFRIRPVSVCYIAELCENCKIKFKPSNEK
jgi:hypothetical protein